jgi:hypothetical protein
MMNIEPQRRGRAGNPRQGAGAGPGGKEEEGPGNKYAIGRGGGVRWTEGKDAWPSYSRGFVAGVSANRFRGAIKRPANRNRE